MLGVGRLAQLRAEQISHEQANLNLLQLTVEDQFRMPSDGKTEWQHGMQRSMLRATRQATTASQPPPGRIDRRMPQGE